MVKARNLSKHPGIGPDDGEPEHHLFAIGPQDDDPPPSPPPKESR